MPRNPKSLFQTAVPRHATEFKQDVLLRFLFRLVMVLAAIAESAFGTDRINPAGTHIRTFGAPRGKTRGAPGRRDYFPPSQCQL